MKKMFSLFLVLSFLTSCEDVIEVDVPSEEPRLIVDALIRIDTTASTSPFFAEVKVSTSSDFFGEISPAQLDEITITNTMLNESIVLLETQPGSGLYRKDTSLDFMTSAELLLQIIYEGSIFEASTTYVPTVPIDKLEQGDATLFSGEETEIVVTFTDSPDRDDFYLFDFDFNEYLVTEDKFYPGQTFQFSYFYEDGIESGREVEVSIIGVDKPFFNYMNQIIVQSGGDQGPFQTPAATVRGNIINVTNIDNNDSFDTVDNKDNFALGYFAVCQSFNKSLIIE